MQHKKMFHYGMTEIQHLKANDPKLGAAIEELGSIERIVMPDPYQALVYAIVGQLISVKAADAIWNRMAEELGDITSANLASYEVLTIKGCGLTMKKAETIYTISTQIESGDFSMEELQRLPDEEILKRLTGIKGVGRWTAEMVLIHGLGRQDVVSFGDAAIRRGMMRLYGLSELDEEAFRRYLANYSPYGTVASLYLWALSL
ncbi:DNA-3-methyladenine glycosylase family protein [Paenibacillus sp. CAU 1782]